MARCRAQNHDDNVETKYFEKHISYMTDCGSHLNLGHARVWIFRNAKISFYLNYLATVHSVNYAAGSGTSSYAKLNIYN